VSDEPQEQGRPRGLLAIAAAIVIAVVVLAVDWLASTGRDALDPPATRSAAPGAAGNASRTISLHGLVAVREPDLHIVRALGADGQLAANEALMLRARLSQPSFLALIAQRSGSAAEPIWPAAQELHAAGEFELDEGDHALLLERAIVGSGAQLALVACAAPPDAEMLRTRTPLLGEGAVHVFPGCAVAALAVSPAPSK
jgi:hypothetical protein